MPLAKIHLVEGRYDDARIGKISGAIQAAFMNTLHVLRTTSISSSLKFRGSGSFIRRRLSACIIPTT